MQIFIIFIHVKNVAISILFLSTYLSLQFIIKVQKTLFYLFFPPNVVHLMW